MNKNLNIAMGHLYLSGYSLRQLGEKFECSHIYIRECLLNLSRIDLGLYFSVIDEMEKRRPESLNKAHVVKRVLKVIELFIAGDKTVIDIANELETTEFIVYRDLTVRAPIINQYIDNVIDRKILDMIPIILKEHSVTSKQKSK